MAGIRQALTRFGGQNADVTKGALKAVRALAITVGPALASNINPIMFQISKKIFDRDIREDVLQTLLTLEIHGGPDMASIITAKVPSYSAR